MSEKETAETLAVKKKAEIDAKKTVNADLVQEPAEPKGAAAGTQPEKGKTEGVVEPKKEVKVEGKEGVQRRIDELVGELKAERNGRQQDADKISVLEKEKRELEEKLNPPQETEDNLISKNESNRMTKYLEEDKEKPREERREMSRDELEEWLDEDKVTATDWMLERKIRREREKHQDRFKLRTTKHIKELVKKQVEYAKKAEEKHPEINTSAREKELKDQGKSDKEILDILCKENPKYKLLLDIYKENPDKYLGEENGPELAITEMEKRLGANPAPAVVKAPDAENDTDKREIARLQAEINRLSGIDVTISSSREDIPAESGHEDDPLYKERLRLAEKAGISKEQLDASLKRRKGIPGGTSYGIKRQNIE